MLTVNARPAVTQRACDPCGPFRLLAALVALLVLMGATGCRAPAESGVGATLWFYPRFKRLEEPRYGFSLAERARALDEYRDTGANSLFELILDPDGGVRRIRLLRSSIREDYHPLLLERLRYTEFSPDPAGVGFRAFYWPVDYDFRSTFEWL